MTDVEGSTRRWETHHHAMPRAMARHDEIICEAVSRHQGFVLKDRGEGDSHFTVFENPLHAAECAIAIQDSLAREDWDQVDPIRVRIAIHTGEAEVRDSDYYGPAVNRCARLRAAGHGGQILVSQATQRLLRSNGTDFELLDLGRHRLKDLLQPERIFQLLAPGLQRDFPPLKTLDEVRHNLPVHLSSFVGRQRELQEVRAVLAQKRLVTLTGPGGNGKTRLALQVGAEVVEQYPDGVWFVELASIRDNDSVPGKVASELKLPSTEGPIGQLAAHFESWQALLILDNCEQVLTGSASLVRQLLRACPELAILATSREPLAVAGEQIYRTPSLRYDLGSQAPTASLISTLDAPALLSERVRDRGLPELLTDAQASAIVRLCKRLDGIPLAIEQAAANLDVHTPEQLLAKLEQHFAMRALEEAGVEERHRTVETTVDWSYQMLRPTERLLFERLSIFVGGWSLDAARAVCSGDSIAESEVDVLLATLIRKSLVFVETTNWDDRRFRLLEVVRDYAVGKLEFSQSLEQRHYEYFFALAQESLNQLVGSHQGHWAQLMEAEHDNLRRALSWAQLHHCSAEMAVALRRFWLRIGFVREGLVALRIAVENERGLDPETEAHAFNALGAFAYKLEDLASAENYYAQSLEGWRGLERKDHEGAVLHNLALVAIQAGHPERAVRYLKQSVELNEASSNEPLVAAALLSLGSYQLQIQELPSAVENLGRAAKIFDSAKDSYNLAVTLSHLGDAEFQLGNRSQASRHILKALDIWQEVHDPFALGVCLLCLSDAALNYGSAQESLGLWESSRVILEAAEAKLDYLEQRRDSVRVGLEASLVPHELSKARTQAEFESLPQAIARARQFCNTVA